jgi:hypothetical protein
MVDGQNERERRKAQVATEFISRIVGSNVQISTEADLNQFFKKKIYHIDLTLFLPQIIISIPFGVVAACHGSAE